MHRSTILIPALLMLLTGGCWRTQSFSINEDPGPDSDSDSDSDSDTGEAIICTGQTWYGDAFISTGTELEEYHGYTAFAGDLILDCNNCTDVNALICLEEIGDSLEINSPFLTNLYGLSSLVEVGSLQDSGFLLIENNEQLASLDGLGSLERIGNRVEIKNNPLITDLDGLGQIQQGEGMLMLRISENPSLQNLDGLGWVDQLSELIIKDNGQLPYCEICQVVQNLDDVDFWQCEDNLDDACWNGALDCP